MTHHITIGIDPGVSSQASVSLVLPYPVSANRYWRSFLPKGHQRPIVTRSPEAKSYIHECQVLAIRAGIRQPLQGRVWLSVRLYPNLPQDWKKRAAKDPDHWDDTVQCMDLGNCEKVLCDALNGIAWNDDKQIRRMMLERMIPDERGARLVVEFWADSSPLIAPELPL